MVPNSVCSPRTDPGSSLGPTSRSRHHALTWAVPSRRLTPTRAHGSRRPAQIRCGPGRSAHSAPSGAGEEELESGWSAEARMKTPRRPALLQGLQTRDSHGRGKGGPLPSRRSPSTPIDIPAAVPSPRLGQLTSWSRLSCLSTPAFIYSYHRHHPKRPQLCPGSRGTPSPRRGQSCTQAPQSRAVRTGLEGGTQSRRASWGRRH